MKSSPQLRRLGKALKWSLVINSVAIASGVLGSLVTKLSVLSVITSILAWPPARVIGWLMKPSSSSPVAVFLAGIEAIFSSIAFYAIVVYVVLLYWPRLKASRNETRPKSGAK